MDPNGYDHNITNRQKHREHYQTVPHECHDLEQIHLYHSANGNPTPGYTNNSISGDSEVSGIYTCFVCGMDRHLARFCSQVQSLTDCGPDNNMLYTYGLPPLVNNNSHEQDVQAVAHHVEKRDRPCTQSSAKCNRIWKFWAHSEVMSDEDVSSKDFIYESWHIIPMTAGLAHQDQFKQLRTRNRADEPHLHYHMSDQPLPQKTWFSSVASMSDREFQGKYVHFNVIPKSDEIDQQKVSKLLVHEIAPPSCDKHPPWNLFDVTTRAFTFWQARVCTAGLHFMWPFTYAPIQMSCLAKNAFNLILHLPHIRYHFCTKIKCSPPSNNLKMVHWLM